MNPKRKVVNQMDDKKGKKEETNCGGKQPRIGTAEKQRAANNPRSIKGEDVKKHPGS
jgi:hypothetical protein